MSNYQRQSQNGRTIESYNGKTFVDGVEITTGQLSFSLKAWAVLAALALVFAGFLGGLYHASSTVDKLVLEGTKAAWASVEPKVAERTEVIRAQATEEVAALKIKLGKLTIAATQCAKKEGSVLFDSGKALLNRLP